MCLVLLKLKTYNMDFTVLRSPPNSKYKIKNINCIFKRPRRHCNSKSLYMIENRSRNGKWLSRVEEEGILMASKPIHPAQPKKGPDLEVLGTIENGLVWRIEHRGIVWNFTKERELPTYTAQSKKIIPSSSCWRQDIWW